MPLSVEYRTVLSLIARCALLALLCTGCPDSFRELLAHRAHERGHHHHPPHGGAAAGRGAGEAGSGAPSSTDPRIPVARAACPELGTGLVELGGLEMQLWVGERRPGQRGPLVVYWHGTGSSASEAVSLLGDAYAEVLAEGGVVAALAETSEAGTNTSTGTWYTGDLAAVDELVACAVEQRDIDARRIYTAGCSAGGVQAGVMAYLRSSYVAAAIPNSGGTVMSFDLEDPTHVPAIMTAHGRTGTDLVIIDYADASRRLSGDIAAQGGFAVDCDHDGGHCASPLALRNAQWQFLKDHPFGVAQEPYASALPASFPRYCSIIPD